jgi:hypothetical protein
VEDSDEVKMIRQRFVISMVVALTALCGAAWSVPAKGGGSDEALLKAGVLAARDLPTRWKSRSVSIRFANMLRGVSGCEEQSAALDLDQRRAPSRSFYDPVTPAGALSSGASNVARVFKNTELADQFLSAYKAPSAAACLHQTNENDLKQRNPSADIATLTDFTPVTGLGTIGDDNVGYEAVITVATSQQGTITGPLDLIYARVGRTVLGFKLGLQSQDISQLKDIVSHPVERVEKAQR